MNELIILWLWLTVVPVICFVAYWGLHIIAWFSFGRKEYYAKHPERLRK